MLIQGRFDPGKASGDSLPFSFDWSQWMDVNAFGVRDQIASAMVTASPVGLSIGSTVTIDPTASLVTATIAGGTNGVTYTIDCMIVTQSGMIAHSQELLPVLDNAR
jgi:hypothetical protein